MNTSSQNNILILGGGYSATRFLEAFLFSRNLNVELASFGVVGKTTQLGKAYSIKTTDFNQLTDFNKYSAIVLSIPCHARIDALNKICQSGYKGGFILEKPPALSLAELDTIERLCCNNPIAVPYTRQYCQLDRYFDVDCGNDIKLLWPTSGLGKVNFAIDLLPHCIDWVYEILARQEKDIHTFEIISAKKDRFIYRISDVQVEVSFVDNTEDGQIHINGQSFKWPDYRKANLRILEHLLTNNLTDKHALFKKLDRNTALLEALIGGI